MVKLLSQYSFIPLINAVSNSSTCFKHRLVLSVTRKRHSKTATWKSRILIFIRKMFQKNR